MRLMTIVLILTPPGNILVVFDNASWNCWLRESVNAIKAFDKAANRSTRSHDKHHRDQKLMMGEKASAIKKSHRFG